MLTEGAIGSDTVRFCGVLDDDLAMDPLVRIGEQRRVEVQKPVVNADTRHIEQIGTGENTQVVDIVVECFVAAAGDVCTVALLRICEVAGDKQAALGNKVRDEDDLVGEVRM